jgi:serine/threonine protein phosphatase PrpC
VLPVTLAMRFAARSHVGMVRDGNEDSVYAGPRVLAVADGMGGHAAGEVASAVAIGAIAQLDEDVPGADLLDALRRSATAANDHLHDMVEGDGALEGMGTTLTALLFAGTRLGMLHIGDSRCYLLRDGELTQITKDHTLVQTLVDEGRISEEQASTHPQRSLITQALDGRGSIDPDLSVREARAGDRYLLCTDGLTGPVAQTSTLRDALLLPDPQDACDRLVQLALRGGGPDNVTVIVADIVEDTAPGSTAPVIAGAAAAAPQPPPPGVTDSSAARARAAEGRDLPPAPPRAAPAAAAGGSKRRHGRRVATALVLSLLLVAAAATAGWAYLRSQYYVGIDGEQVAVFRGVRSTVGGVALSTVEERTPLEMDRLDEDALAQVERGIVAKDREEAGEIVERLIERAGPECIPDTAVPAPTQPPLGSLLPASPSPSPPPLAPSPPGTAAAPTPIPTFIPAPSPSPPPTTGLARCPALAS